MSQKDEIENDHHSLPCFETIHGSPYDHCRHLAAFNALAMEIKDHNQLNFVTMDPSKHGCRSCDSSFHNTFANTESSIDINFQKMLKFRKCEPFGGKFMIHREVSHLYKHLKPTFAMVKAREHTAIQKMQLKNHVISELNYITQKRFLDGDLHWLSDLRHSRVLMNQMNLLPRVYVYSSSRSTPCRLTLAGNMSMPLHQISECETKCEDQLTTITIPSQTSGRGKSGITFYQGCAEQDKISHGNPQSQFPSQIPNPKSQTQNMSKKCHGNYQQSQSTFKCKTINLDVPSKLEFNSILLPNSVTLASIPAIWMCQNLSSHTSVADISNFFGSLELSVHSSIQQGEVFPADANGKPDFNLRKATQWKVAFSKTQRYGLKDASSYSATALKLCIQQFKNDHPLTEEKVKFLFSIAKIALESDTFADDVSLSLFNHQFEKYKNMQNENITTEDSKSYLIKDTWKMITEILAYGNFFLKGIETTPQSLQDELNTLPLLKDNLETSKLKIQSKPTPQQSPNPIPSQIGMGSTPNGNGPPQIEKTSHIPDSSNQEALVKEMSWDDIIWKKHVFSIEQRPHPELVHAQTLTEKGEIEIQIGAIGNQVQGVGGTKLIQDSTAFEKQNQNLKVKRLSKISDVNGQGGHNFNRDVFLGHTPKAGKPFCKHLGRFLHDNNSISLGSDYFEIKVKKRKYIIRKLEDFESFAKNNIISQRICLQLVARIYDLDGSLYYGATKLFGKLAVRSFQREVKSWDAPVSAECLEHIKTFLYYFFQINGRQVERLSLTYGMKSDYCLWGESDASQTFTSYRILLLEFSTIGNNTKTKILRRYFITQCDQCQKLIDSKYDYMPDKCTQHKNEPYETVCFQPILSDSFLAPAKAASLPLLEMSALSRSIGALTEIRDFLYSRVGIFVEPQRVIAVVDSKAALILSRTSPSALSTRLRNQCVNIQLKLSKNNLCPFKNLFFISQKIVRLTADLGTKCPLQKSKEYKLKFLENNMYQQQFLKIHPSKWSQFLDGVSILPKLNKSHLMALEINPSYYPNISETPLPKFYDTGIKFLDNQHFDEQKSKDDRMQYNKAQCNITQYSNAQCNTVHSRVEKDDVVELLSVTAMRQAINSLPPSPHTPLFTVQCKGTHDMFAPGYCTTSQVLKATKNEPKNDFNRMFFENLIQRKFSFFTGNRSAINIIGLAFTFVDKCKMRVKQRKLGEQKNSQSILPLHLKNVDLCKSYQCQKDNRGGWYECDREKVHHGGELAMSLSCGVQNCDLPCKGAIPTLYSNATHPLMYISSAPSADQRDYPSYMKYIRCIMTKMIHHGYTESYNIYAKSAALLLLSFFYSANSTNQKHIIFSSKYNDIEFWVIQGSIIKEPLPFDIYTLFSQALLINLDSKSILADLLVYDAHEKRKHSLGIYSETILVALSGCFIGNLKKKLNDISCAICNKKKATSAQKRAGMATAPFAATDWITSIKKFDCECIIDYLVITSMQGLRYILIVVFKNSLMTRYKIMRNYSSTSLLYALIELHNDFGLTVFHADAGSQIYALATHLSALTDEHRLSLLENPEGSERIHKSHLGKFFQNRNRGFPFPRLIVKVNLAKRHQSIGITEFRINLVKLTMGKFEILYGNRDISDQELSCIMSITLGIINQIPSFTFQNRILSPACITKMSKPHDTALLDLPNFYHKKYPDISIFLQECRTNALLAITESKLSLFESQPVIRYTNRIKGYLITPGCIVLDLVLVKENQTLTGALSRVIAKTANGMGCIIFRYDNQKHRQFLTRQYSDLAFVSGKLLQLDDNKPIYKIFSLPKLCWDILEQAKPGVQLDSEEEANQHFQKLPQEVKQALNEQLNDQQLGRGHRTKFINKRYAHTIFK